MNLKTSLNSIVLSACLVVLLTACGGGGSSNPPAQEPPIVVDPIEEVPTNTISHAYFRDQDSASGTLGGSIILEVSAAEATQPFKTESVWIYWADANGNKLDGTASIAWLKTESFKSESESTFNIVIPTGTRIPENAQSSSQALILYPHNGNGEAETGTLIKFHDFIGNTQLSGPGGNEYFPWYYGQPPASSADPAEFTVLRDKISVHRDENGLCIFDNGLVGVIDMDNTVDEAWVAGKGSGPNAQANDANDSLFPIYEYPCAEAPINTHRWVGDRAADTEDGIEYVWTYSTINDAMFYGTIVYDTFVKYLGEPPLDEKLRIRLHYENRGSTTGYWDGAYATFGDGYFRQYSAASLDSIGHEIGHGVLNRIMGVDFFQASSTEGMSKGFRTVHEAFGDISGVMAWYEYGQLKGEDQSGSIGADNYWIHGEENTGGVIGRIRRLNQIVTEYEAIETMLDYDDTNSNYYLSIGMFTYPFYLLQEKWGMEEAYSLYIAAARNCWTSTMNHTQLAQCLKQQAALISAEKEADVVTAFKVVKIKLFDEGVLSHYQFVKTKLHTQFTDDSRSTNQVSKWLWDFGDGETSTEEKPQHTYASAGNYSVKLTTEDTEGYKDDFTRKVSVTDQYCRITTGLDPENDIGQVVINGTNLNFNTDKWDYRDDAPIDLSDPNNRMLNLNITGASNDAVAETTKWTVWLDINDDGFYTNEEIIRSEEIAKDTTYGWTTSIDLTAFIADAEVAAGEAKFIRVVGENSYGNACSSAAGEAFDVKITWQ
jgi:vibriolysin